LAHV